MIGPTIVFVLYHRNLYSNYSHMILSDKQNTVILNDAKCYIGIDLYCDTKRSLLGLCYCHRIMLEHW